MLKKFKVSMKYEFEMCCKEKPDPNDVTFKVAEDLEDYDADALLDRFSFENVEEIK